MTASAHKVISIFDIFKIGIGPSSSHTLGPWLAALDFIKSFTNEGHTLSDILSLSVELYGSLALTGKGHQTDKAILLGLMGFDPKTFDTNLVKSITDSIHSNKELIINNSVHISFDPNKDIIYYKSKVLDCHPNGMRFSLTLKNNTTYFSEYASTGGGFIEKNGKSTKVSLSAPSYPSQTAQDIIHWHQKTTNTLPQLILENESYWQSPTSITENLDSIIATMHQCVLNGFQTEGTLPGGLNVQRRAPTMLKQCLSLEYPKNIETLIQTIQQQNLKFRDTSKIISAFALAVNEENASMGRIVTSPTNGAAGVIPAVMLYAQCFESKTQKDLHDFLLVAGEIGTLFVKSATISAAMGGCQAEIGVSSAMAAAGLTQILGGTPHQVLEAAEIAMEHHLGLTCDPIAGLVQIPCIERNAMGAMKAITASELALSRTNSKACVSLDEVIRSMWLTAQDMNSKYKETSTGGLAISVNQKGC